MKSQEVNVVFIVDPATDEYDFDAALARGKIIGLSRRPILVDSICTITAVTVV